MNCAVYYSKLLSSFIFITSDFTGSYGCYRNPEQVTKDLYISQTYTAYREDYNTEDYIFLGDYFITSGTDHDNLGEHLFDKYPELFI